MAHQFPDGDRFLALGGEFRPVRGDRARRNRSDLARRGDGRGCWRPPCPSRTTARRCHAPSADRDGHNRPRCRAPAHRGGRPRAPLRRRSGGGTIWRTSTPAGQSVARYASRPCGQPSQTRFAAVQRRLGGRTHNLPHSPVHRVELSRRRCGGIPSNRCRASNSTQCRSARKDSSATAGTPFSIAPPGSASPLAAIRSCFSPAPGCAADGAVEIVLPDGRISRGDEDLSDWLGRPVNLRRADEARRAPIRERRRLRARGIRHLGRVRRLRRRLPRPGRGERVAGRDRHDRRLGPPPVSRQRAAGHGRGRPRSSLVGRSRLSWRAQLSVKRRLGRCVVTTRPQPGGIDRDLDVLRTINRERDGALAVGALVIAAGGVAGRRQALRAEGQS